MSTQPKKVASEVEAAAAAKAAAEAPAGPIKITLRKEIMNKDAVPTKEIEFREPTAEDITVCGVPVNMYFDGAGNAQYTFDAPKMSAMIARLASTPMPFIAKMNTRDWMTCAWAIAGFFTPDLEKL